MSKSDSNEKKSICFGDFNEYINLILLSMFVIVVLTTLCFNCCSNRKQVQKEDTETIQQSMDTVNDSTPTQQ